MDPDAQLYGLVAHLLVEVDALAMRRRGLFSQSWHNVAELRPRVLPHARIYRHVYRGRTWYVIQDSAGGRYHRLSPGAYEFVTRMNGSKSVQTLWEEACRLGGDHIPTQDEIVELLMQLYTNDLLDCDVTPDAAELFDRYRKRRRAKLKQWFANPLSIRIPLLDPDAFLTRWSEKLAWAFTFRGLAIWLTAVIPALFLAGAHWDELTGNLSDQVLASQNLLLLTLLFPLVKAMHELGHGFATKVWGGSVHEVGLMFLVFAPVPYVDASAASAFRSKYQRAIVGASGMLIEVFLAALAMYVWVLVEPGVVRAAAFNVMFIAGVSTILVNGNPLLRYDGYFILVDLLEIPNLAQRGQRYLTYLSDRHLFGASDLEPPKELPEEKRWLVSYTIASWIYRVIITLTIIVFVASEFFIFGVLLALWGTFTLLFKPAWKAIKHVRESPTLQRHRDKAIRVSLGLVAGVLLITCVIPVPLRTQAEGVVWLPEEALVRAGTSGFIEGWLTEPGSSVSRGTPLLVMADSSLSTDLKAAEAQLAETKTLYSAAQFTNRVEAGLLRQRLMEAHQTLARFRQRHDNLIVYSETAGWFTVSQPEDMAGQFVKKGELLGYILDRQHLIARVAVVQDDIDLVQARLRSAEIRFSDRIPQRYETRVLRQVPGAVNELPSAALSPAGGGSIAVDPNDPSGLKTLERIFLFDLGLPADTPPSAFGERVYVRFSHEWEPLAQQWYRRLRQLFLSHFHV